MNHMNSKILMGLAAAVVIAIGAATAISVNRQPVSGPAQPTGYALPELRDHINDVTGVTLTAAEDKAVVTLAKTAKGWAVQEKGGYPADTGKLRELLLKLADASLLQQKTANEQRYAELGVEDVKAMDAKGLMVILQGLAKPAQIIVGNYSGKAGGTFVRRAEDKQSWLAKGNLSFDRIPANWIVKAIADIGTERIAEITLTQPGGKGVRLYKDQPTDTVFKVADVPAGRELAAESVLNGLASTLAGLTLVDVSSAQDTKGPGEAQLLQATYRTFDGVKVDVQAWKQDDKHYARFTVVLEQDKAETRIQEDQAKAKTDFEEKQKSDPKAAAPLAVSDSSQDREQRLAALAAEVGALSQRVDGWIYVIPPFKYSNMDKSMDDLLKPKEAAKPATDKAKETKPEKRSAKKKRKG